MALFVFVLDVQKEDGGVFAVRHGPEPEEIYAALLADPPPTFRAVRIHRRRTGLFIVQLAGRPDWPELQDKVTRMQKLQASPMAPVVRCAVQTMCPDEEEAFRKALVGQLAPEEQMWLQPQPEDVTDITTLVRMPFMVPLWEEAIPLAIPATGDPAVTMASEVPTSKGGPAKRTAGAGGEPGSTSTTASTMGAVLTTAMTTTAATGLTAAAVRQPSPGLRSRLAGLASLIAGVVGAGGRKSGSGAHLVAQPGGSGLGALGSAATLPISQSKASKTRGVLPPRHLSAIPGTGASSVSSGDEWTEQELLAINDVWMAKVFPIIRKEYHAGLADPASLGKTWQDARHLSGVQEVEVVEPSVQPLHSSPEDAKLVRKLDLDDSVLSHREDLLTKAVSMNMRHPPTLPEFHGNQLMKNSVAFEGWQNRVLQAGQAGYTEDQVMAAISRSCREDALVTLTQLQTGTVPITVKQVLSEFGSLFSRSAEDDSLVKQLFNIEQGESELVNSYYLRLCALLNDVVVNCPDYPLDRDFTQRQRFFHGLRVEI